MTKDSKYTLAHYRDQKRNNWNRTCPQCGKREFSPYIDLYTGRPIDDKHCGKCNRETNCGYHQPPREWFAEHRPEHREWLPREEFIAKKQQERREAEEARRRYEEEQRKKPRFDYFASKQPMEVQEYLNQMKHCLLKCQAYTHTLAQWLYTMFPRERVDYALNRYRVGGTRDGRTVFWGIDLRGRTRTGKVMAYGLDGHRKKGCPGAFNWVHSILGLKQLAPQCLFGEHLINDNVNVNENCYPLPLRGLPLKEGECNHRDKAIQKELSPFKGDERRNRVTKRRGYTIALVESEKTALIMSILVPQTTWLATGGKQNFKHEMLWTICEQDVAVYPDADALDNWSRKMEELNREHGYRFFIPDWYREKCTTEAIAKKMDIADMLLV